VKGKVNAPSENRIIIAKRNDGKMLAAMRQALT